jgi:hypothetical protein
MPHTSRIGRFQIENLQHKVDVYVDTITFHVSRMNRYLKKRSPPLWKDDYLDPNL